MMHHLTRYPRVGAVTGNPRILNRSSIQVVTVGEFSSIIGLIKRAQRTYGRIFTVSGAIVGFRKTALDRIGYWRDDMITEDIDGHGAYSSIIGTCNMSQEHCAISICLKPSTAVETEAACVGHKEEWRFYLLIYQTYLGGIDAVWGSLH